MARRGRTRGRPAAESAGAMPCNERSEPCAIGSVCQRVRFFGLRDREAGGL